MRATTRMVYVYNPECGCAVCSNGGKVRQADPHGSHCYGDGNEHFPPPGPRPTVTSTGRIGTHAEKYGAGR